MVGSHDCAITAEDEITYILTADQMSHANVTIDFQDQSSPGSTRNDYIAEMTRIGLDYPPHAGETKVRGRNS